MKTAMANRPETVTRAEHLLAELLASVMHVDRVPIDQDFFAELGADSLVMAHFCARVRKCADLPPVSMKDVYAHPTIRRLAAAIAATAPTAPQPTASAAAIAATPTTAREYLLCGTLQALFYLGYTYLGVFAAVEGYQWLIAGAQGLAKMLRLGLFGSAAFFVMCLVPIAAKWLLIGRWQSQQIRLWSLAYIRFWIVKTLIRSNPCIHLFIGSPLYGLYLRALGASIGPRTVILSRHIPVCTDLLTIGAGSVLRRDAFFQCYRAEADRIETGPVTLGQNVLVGEAAVLDIGTTMGDGAQLGHASALHSGQTIPAGEHWHGSPAQPTTTDYVRVAPTRCSTLRRTLYGAFTLIGVFFLLAPLLESGFGLLFLWSSSLAGTLDPSLHSSSGSLTAYGWLAEALTFATVFFFGALLVGLLAVGLLPRVLGMFIKPDTVYPLYSFHYAIHRTIAWLGRQRFLTVLFGDSSYIVHLLSWIGYRLTPVVQTGSNFGSEVTTTNPLLTSVGSGTMVADGLYLINDEVSNSSFRVSRTAIGPCNFVGNYVTYPAGAKTADNCLLAIKVMVPIDGPTRQGVGLLGSPPFEIPRSVERDSRFDYLQHGEALRQGLAAKNRFNLKTISLFLFTRWLGVLLVVLIDLAAVELFYDVLAHALMAALFTFSAVTAIAYYALVERCFIALAPAPPPICSIYDPDFWWVERNWKLHPISVYHLFDGTPFKGLLWRLIGVSVGKRLFDDGVHISEPTLTTIGDECVLNHASKIQCESQEDGTYKSGPTTLGAGCTLGVNAFVHYGVTMGDGSLLVADSFLMKGEDVPPGTRWAGNPAREN
ncbi:Pls/PosA family non-ribosomal peptide synthetase [Vogesella facilis]|uniref:Pls/PosA family non-ribosomal peptide synthetase n=1 Tax=Vogesella facilis TaxID=1655232 RepID=A0ABV7RBX1_9NEIS